MCASARRPQPGMPRWRSTRSGWYSVWLRAKELASDGDQLISAAMRPGPSTFRPYVLAEEMAKAMLDHQLESTVVTTSDGRLVGLLLQKGRGPGRRKQKRMSKTSTGILRCTSCGRAIEACACCDERDCPPPICDRCLTEAILKTIRPQYVHRGASLTEGPAHQGSVPA